jgi:hypothetical protein
VVQPDPERPGQWKHVMLAQFAPSAESEGRWYDAGEGLQSGYQEEGGFTVAPDVDPRKHFRFLVMGRARSGMTVRMTYAARMASHKDAKRSSPPKKSGRGQSRSALNAYV